MLAPLFLLGGMIGAYLEFKSPGFGVAGALGDLLPAILCRPLCRWIDRFRGDRSVYPGHAVGAWRASLFPGVTLLALLGTALMVGALLFAMVDFYPNQPLDLSLEVLMRPC